LGVLYGADQPRAVCLRSTMDKGAAKIKYDVQATPHTGTRTQE
jgi:hypothetical protein